MKKVFPMTAAFLLLGSGVLHAGDIESISQSCDECHGSGGVSQWDDVPTIAGIDAFVHSDALYMYRDKERPCPSSEYRLGDTGRAATSMCEVVADFDDDTIESLAEHYAALDFVAAKQDFDPALAGKGESIHDSECAKCHSDGGSNAEDEASILAGQWMGYLRNSFAEFKSGDRMQPEKMQEKLDGIGDADIEALAHYYASQQ